MTYDDRPLWEQNQSVTKTNLEQKKEIISPKPQYWAGLKPSAPYPSPVLSWWEQETRKRREGLINDVDINDMKAAKIGSLNAWSETIKKHPKEVQDFLNDPTKEGWERIKPLKSS